MPKLLLVDDDTSLTESVSELLSDEEFLVDVAHSPADAQAMLDVSGYDLIILDRMMRGTDGLNLLKSLRNRQYQGPVLMLTGMDTTDDKVNGLEAGADDYLTKPFNSRELMSRVRALLRRAPLMHSSELRHGDIAIDLAARRVFRNEVEISLTRQEFLLLEFFLRHPGQIFSAEALVARAWPASAETSPDVVRVHLTHLRKKLGTGGSGNSIIKTVFGQGYIFDDGTRV